MRYLLILVLAVSASAQVVKAPIGKKIMLFGGEDHKVYLGCLSCSEFASDSLLNKFGNFGSSFSALSIYNDFGIYGSSFSATSPCNDFATDPPVIVDNNGGFYGYLTMNESKPKRVQNEKVLGWLTGVCQSH